MGFKASYEVGSKSTQAWGGPCSIKCILEDIKSAPTPSLSFLVLSPFLLVVPLFYKWKYIRRHWSSLGRKAGLRSRLYMRSGKVIVNSAKGPIPHDLFEFGLSINQ
jgi:hypothetical protein